MALFMYLAIRGVYCLGHLSLLHVTWPPQSTDPSQSKGQPSKRELKEKPCLLMVGAAISHAKGHGHSDTFFIGGLIHPNPFHAFCPSGSSPAFPWLLSISVQYFTKDVRNIKGRRMGGRGSESWQ